MNLPPIPSKNHRLGSLKREKFGPSVSDSEVRCRYCNGFCIKNGKERNGQQRYKCRECKKSQQLKYRYNAYSPLLNNNIVALTKEGVGIRGTVRLLRISPTTLIHRIKKIAGEIKEPLLKYDGKTYEVDELCTFIRGKHKLIWIVSAYERERGAIVRFQVGSRTNKTLNRVLISLKLSNAKKIYTDKLKQYQFLIPKGKHSTKVRSTNHIERMHLNLRTHLKRLNRRSICFSRSISMLVSILKIYLWKKSSCIT